MDAAWVQGLCHVLNPDKEAGRLVLIHRMGAKHVEDKLPGLIESVRATGVPVLWVCDPMHGNTETTASGVKTRRFDNILAELEAAFRVHRAMGSYLGGVHFELTGEDVTECTGGARGLVDADLAQGLPLAGRPAAQLRAGPRTRDADRDRGPFGLTRGSSRRPAASTASASVRGISRHSPGARPSTVHGPDGPADQPQRRKAHGSRHAPHLPVAALAQLEFDPGGGNRLAHADRRVARPQSRRLVDHAGGGGAAGTVVERHALPQGLERLVGRRAFDLHAVALGERRARLADARLPRPEVGQQHQAFAVEVEPSCGIETRQRNEVARASAGRRPT